MQIFNVSPDVFQKLPDVCFGIVVVRGLNNREAIPEIGSFFHLSQLALKEKLAGRKAKEHPPILPYRDAFQRININPNKFPPSIEALTGRIEKGKLLPEINPVVDLSNGISLTYGIPLGAHDLASSTAPLEVRISQPEDQFIPFGSNEPERIDPDEILYVSGSQVKTRRWIWRQSEFGKITTESRDIFFPLDGFESINGKQVKAARDHLASLLEKHFHVTPYVGWVNQENPTCSF